MRYLKHIKMIRLSVLDLCAFLVFTEIKMNFIDNGSVIEWAISKSRVPCNKLGWGFSIGFYLAPKGELGLRREKQPAVRKKKGTWDSDKIKLITQPLFLPSSCPD